MSSPTPADPPKAAPGGRPKAIECASVVLFILVGFYFVIPLLMYLGFAIAGVAVALDDRYLVRFAALGVTGAVVTVTTTALLVWLTVMVRRGQNGARITATALLIVGITYTGADAVRDLLAEPVVLPLFAPIALLLMIEALVLLWSPQSRDYFDLTRTRQRPA